MTILNKSKMLVCLQHYYRWCIYKCLFSYSLQALSIVFFVFCSKYKSDWNIQGMSKMLNLNINNVKVIWQQYYIHSRQVLKELSDQGHQKQQQSQHVVGLHLMKWQFLHSVLFFQKKYLSIYNQYSIHWPKVLVSPIFWVPICKSLTSDYPNSQNIKILFRISPQQKCL